MSGLPETPPRVVLDTNVLVSGLLTPVGSSARLVDLAQAGAVQLLYDERMVREHHQVLLRPRFGFSPETIAWFLEFLRVHGEIVIARPLPAASQDLSDQPFWEVAVSGQASLLVTGNAKHYPKHPPEGLHVVTPAQALERLTVA